MKKFILLLCLVTSASLAWAADMRLTEENFLSWIKDQKIAGFVVDEESFENYVDQEFTIDFMAMGVPSHLSIKVEGAGAMAELKGERQLGAGSTVGEYTEINVGGLKAVYWTMKTMKNVTFVNVEVPQINGELRLLTSPGKSVDEMRVIVAGLDLKALK